VTGTILARLLSWREANNECRRAAAEWTALRDGPLRQVGRDLPAKEMRHLQHTVYRINSLVFLYAHLRRAGHSTELGVLLGAITHLLDYAYDHRRLSAADLRAMEEVVIAHRRPDPHDDLQAALSVLAERAWGLVADPASVRTRLADMLVTQRRSLAQSAGQPMPAGQLQQVTWDKGHHSLCLYFAAVNPDFSVGEARALRSFGAYMQYMDDLEDLYEDRAEGRQSPVARTLAGLPKATRLFRAARQDLASYYGGDRGRYNYGVFIAWLALFHVGILTAAVIREVTLLLPLRAQRGLDRCQQWLAGRVPFFQVAPLSVVRGRPR